jgi:hypothetical protein
LLCPLCVVIFFATEHQNTTSLRERYGPSKAEDCLIWC